MGKIYVVTASGGSYDDFWQNNMCARFSMHDAELEVERLKKQGDKISAMLRQVQNAYHKYAKENSVEMEQMPALPKCPKNPSKETVIQHKRAMDAYYKEVAPIARRNENKHIEMLTAAKEVARQEALSLGADEDDLKAMGFSEDYWPIHVEIDVHYEIEELEIK